METVQIEKEILINTLDALDDNCNFFACKGSLFPPLHMRTCRNCDASWEMKMALVGYVKEEMDHISDMYDKAEGRLWRIMDNCQHPNVDYDLEEVCPCPDCHWTFGEDEHISINRVIMKENKAIHDSVDLLVDFLENTMNEVVDEKLKEII